MHLKYLIFSFLVLIFLYQSCTNPFAPAEAGEDSPSSLLLTEQRNPDEVLTNFKYAYTFQDSLVYSELLDSTFVFRSMDFNYAPPVPIQWGRDVELKTTARMFRFFNTIDLTFNVVTRDTTNADTTEILDRITFTLTLDGGTTIPILNGEVEFAYVRRGEKWLIGLWEDKQI